MYNFVAIDIDDTLLNHQLEISEPNKKAIMTAHKRGIYVTLATGRMFTSSLPFAEELNLDIPLITYHGALVKRVGSGEVLSHQPVPLSLAREIARFSQEKNLHLNVYLDDKLYVEREDEYTEFYVNIAKIPFQVAGDLVSFLDKPPTKLTIVSEKEVVNHVSEELTKLYGDRLTITQSKEQFLEITHPRVNKGEALDRLAEKYQVPIDQVMAIGDSLNDLPMIERAGLGVAVANAKQEVLDRADIIVASNDDSGVKDALERYVIT